MSDARIIQSARRSPGFTLIELMVAITAGMFVAIGAFALARQGSRFFQQEARIANAQFSATVGCDRLRADIARAGFLTTANVQRDPFRCGSTAGWPSPGMPSLAAIRITAATPTAVQDSVNGLAPDQITLTGSYSTVENFPSARRDRRRQVPGHAAAEQRRHDPGEHRGDGGGLGTIFQSGRVLRLLTPPGTTSLARSTARASTGREKCRVLENQSPIAFAETRLDLRRRGLRRRHAGQRRRHDSLRNPRPGGGFAGYRSLRPSLRARGREPL